MGRHRGSPKNSKAGKGKGGESDDSGKLGLGKRRDGSAPCRAIDPALPGRLWEGGSPIGEGVWVAWGDVIGASREAGDGNDVPYIMGPIMTAQEARKRTEAMDHLIK